MADQLERDEPTCSVLPRLLLSYGATTETVEFRAVSAHLEPACSLIAEALAAGERTYGSAQGGETPSATPADMAPPDGPFSSPNERDLPVACGGLKRFDDRTAEIKRMYVIPKARGRGVARSLLMALEEEAQRLGYRRARLDAGTRQADARSACST